MIRKIKSILSEFLNSESNIFKVMTAMIIPALTVFVAVIALFVTQSEPVVNNIDNNINNEFDYSTTYYDNTTKFFSEPTEEIVEPELPNKYFIVGLEYIEQNDYENALKYLLLAEEESIRITGSYSTETCTYRYNLGLLYSYLSKYQEALDCFNNAMVAFKGNSKNRHMEALCYKKIGEIYIDMEEGELAIKYSEQALQMIDLDESRVNYTSFLLSLGNAYCINYNFIEAEKYIELAYKLDMYLNNTDTIKSSLGYATLLIGMQNYESALDLLEETIILIGEIYNYEESSLARCYYLLGITSIEMGKYDDGVTYTKKSIEIMTNILGAENRNNAVYYHNLAMGYYLQGNIEKSISTLKISIDINQKYNDKIFLAQQYFSIGIMYENNNDTIEALMYYNKIIDIKNSEVGKHDIFANIINLYERMAEIYWNSNDSINTLKMYNLMLEEADSEIERANAYLSIGKTYVKYDYYDRAIEYLEKALEILGSTYGYDSTETCEAYLYLGTSLYYMGKYDDAIYYLEKITGQRDFESKVNIYYQTITFYQIAIVYLSLEEYDLAQDFFSKALKAFSLMSEEQKKSLENIERSIIEIMNYTIEE